MAGLSVTLGAMSVTLGAIVTATRAAKQAWHGGYAHTALSPSLTSPVPS
jgi:multisubunit Na+/H+ antiporter MnhG subunit